MAIHHTRYRRSLLDRLIDEQKETTGLSLTYSLDELRNSVARDIENLLNSRAAFDFEALGAMPNVRKSIVCFGVRDFVGKSSENSVEKQFVSQSLHHALASFEPRLRDVHVKVQDKDGPKGSFLFTIHAVLMAHPSAEPVAFDALLQPSLSRFSVAPSRNLALAA